MDIRTLIPACTNVPDHPFRVLGIDLGTTNSTVAEVVYNPESISPPTVECLDIDLLTGNENPETGPLVPSIVAHFDGETIVGTKARRLLDRSADLHLEQNRHIFFECKNDMGIKRTYHRAPKGSRTSAEVGGVVLSFLHNAALGRGDPPKRTVITVPASFQSAQRNDTRKAAGIAGITIGPGDLLDEPVAAFIDYLASHATDDALLTVGERNVLVFDFGGGTCDVAIFRLSRSAEVRGPTIAPIAVSRYHRLGGGDIDAAILYEILLPQFCEQNDLAPHDLEYDDKKTRLEPCLKPAAEELKIRLCDKMRCGGTGNVKVTLATTQHCTVLGKRCTLKQASLTAAEFERILVPFLDEDAVCTNTTEYRLTCSIFSPIADALDRSGLPAAFIDCVLLAGGSSLIPQVAKAVAGWFRNATLLTYPDRLATQTTVARGAALHALSLALSGKPIIQPVSQDAIAIRCDKGRIPLVPGGVSLPYPANGWGVVDDLVVPEQNMLDTLKLRVELTAGTEDRPVYAGMWEVEGLVNKGDPIHVRYCYDENQILNLELTIGDGVDHGKHAAAIENPLTQVINPNRTRIKILEVEEEIKSGELADFQRNTRMQELACLYAEIGQREKAIAILRKVLRWRGDADAGVINHLGLLYGELGNQINEEKLYRQAVAVNKMFSAPLFNMALMQKRQGKLQDALQSVENAIEKEMDPPYLVLKGQLLQNLGKENDARRLMENALKEFPPISRQSEWHLTWFKRAATILEQNDALRNAEKEMQRRKMEKETVVAETGVLPEKKG